MNLLRFIVIIDYFANAALSKMGFGVMAVTGCFAGQLFNLLIGFGSALLRQTIKKLFFCLQTSRNYILYSGNINFDIFSSTNLEKNCVPILVISFCLANLISVLIITSFNQYI